MHAQHSSLSHAVLCACFVEEFTLYVTFATLEAAIPLTFSSLASRVVRQLVHQATSILADLLTLSVVADSSIDIRHGSHTSLSCLVRS